MILAAVERALAGAGVARRGESRVLVACSGGADSVALAHAAATLLGARRVILGHVDHAVRAGSAADADFVRAYAVALGADVAVTRLEPGRDDEARLRELRYGALDAQRIAAGAEVVLTAHTADDQAETVLLALLRSAHPSALAGIRAARPGVLRPLLSVARAALRAYAREHALSWREDPTNAEPRWLRNRVRKELLPLIESRYRPGFAARLIALGALVDGLPLPRAETPPPRASNTPPPPVVEGGMEISVERRVWDGATLPRDARTAMFDAAALPRVVVRPIRPGDRIRPMGLGGSKKLQDVLVDAKVPREARSRLWVAADPSGPEGELVWVPGVARAERAPLGPSTTEIWILTCGAYADPSL